MELGRNYFFKHLGEERQVRNGPAIGVNFRGEGGFFKEG